MKLFTKEVEKALQSQWGEASDLESQKVVAKIFDPAGSWTWYLMNQDPNDPEYLWGIVKGNEIELGSVNKKDLENYRGRLGIKLERDLYYEPMQAKVVYDKLIKGEHI